MSILLLLAAPAAAMDNSNFKGRSENIIDLRLNETTSPYRHAVVAMTEAISGMGYVVELMKFDKECAPIKQILPAMNALEDRLRTSHPTKDLPSETDLNVDPGLRARVLKAGACDSAFSSLLSMVGEKQKKVREAAAALVTNYEGSYQGAKKIREMVRGQNYQKCKIPEGIKRGIYETIEAHRQRQTTIGEVIEGTAAEKISPSGGDSQAVGPFGFGVYKYFVHSGPDEFVKSYEALNSALQAKRVYLENIQADLQRISTFSSGGARCSGLK